MSKIKVKTRYKKLLADTTTPVNIYLKLRDNFPNSLLLESSDYHGNENSFSYICCKPVAEFKVVNEHIHQKYPDTTSESKKINHKSEVVDGLREFYTQFDVSNSEFEFINNGLFGYIGYDAVRYFEDVQIEKDQSIVPDILYHIYRFVIVINHFKNELYIFEHSYGDTTYSETLETIQSLIRNKNIATYNFSNDSDENSNFTDDEFLDIISKGKDHCHRGDVFQIVLSRRFSQSFKGDEFNVYRALRSINPSPYLFYFDYGSFKIFGSSPEAQLVVKDNKALIYPIAGTFKRSGDDTTDYKLAEDLMNDPKENSEHVMLVDLARNDLSRNGENVNVETFKEIQYYSHVIHLVSKVSAEVKSENLTNIVADTFPAGTLSGAPKHNAMKLIGNYENENRGLYGGCIGFLGFNHDFNHAIVIRSFFSKDNVLYYQAGAGVVEKSEPENELQEVNNKLMALRKAINMAEKI
ncbi:MAG: anthranilate synthase component I [Bacteroidetes bacterium]|nr:MAG: anthranilate synthase component I [Bacteroidota bacterium]